MKRFISVLIGFFLFFPSLTFADDIGPNEEYVQYSLNKQFYLKMIPSSAYGELGEGRGFEVGELQDKFLWRVDWYATSVELSDDGKYLVRHGPWVQEFSDLAIAFYQEGKLLKEYKVEDLVKDKSKVARTVSHFQWRRMHDFWKIRGIDFQTGFSEDDKYYLLATTDNRFYVFYVDSGEIYKELQASDMLDNPIELFAREGLSINFRQ